MIVSAFHGNGGWRSRDLPESVSQDSRTSSSWNRIPLMTAGRRTASIALVVFTLSCGPIRVGEPADGMISIGEEYEGACEKLRAAGAFEITNIVHFYAGLSPYSVAKTKAGEIVVSSHLLLYTNQPSQEIRSWFLLPDNTCASLFVRQGSASRITSIELGERGKGFLPPAKALQPDGFSPAVEDTANGSVPFEILEEEKPSGTGFWSRQIKETVDGLRLADWSASGMRRATLTTGMPLRLAAAILAGHAAEDISGDVEMSATVEYLRGKYPRSIPLLRLYVLPGKTLLILHARFDPLSTEQFTVQEFMVGEPGVGYPGKMEVHKQKFTRSETLDVKDLVRSAGGLHFAARIGDLESMRGYLREGKTAVDGRDREGFTPLHWAVKRGKVEAAQALLQFGADVNAPDSDGDTPLILAAWKGRPGLVAVLLEHGALTETLNHRKMSAFLAAGIRGDLATVALLLDKYHADANQADPSGFTLLHRAADNSNAELARILLKHGADPNLCRSESISPLYDAISSGTAEVVRLLLEAGASVRPARGNEWRPLDAVAQNGSVEIARLLIEQGARPDGPALFAAANSGNAGVVKLFLEHGADLKYTENTWQRTALHTAHSAEVVRVLVQAGMDIEVKNEIGETPLHEAAHFAPPEVVVALLELGADPHAVSHWKQTPLQVAEGRDRPGKAEILQTLRVAMTRVPPKKPAPDKK